MRRINEFREAPDMLRGVGLPWSCRTALVEAASSLRLHSELKKQRNRENKEKNERSKRKIKKEKKN